MAKNLLMGVVLVVSCYAAVDAFFGIRPCGIPCQIACRYGQLRDSKGCLTCRCKPGPVIPFLRVNKQCPPVCAVHCEFGNVLDHRGCPTCQCKTSGPGQLLRSRRSASVRSPIQSPVQGSVESPVQSPVESPVELPVELPVQSPVAKCPLVACMANKCPNGFKTDSNGCFTCQCKPSVCPVFKCARFCPNGFVKDNNGCDTCTCKPYSCRPTVNCKKLCPSGYVQRKGCLTCECKPAEPIECEKCPSNCFTSRQLLRNGCARCICLKPRDLEIRPLTFPPFTRKPWGPLTPWDPPKPWGPPNPWDPPQTWDPVAIPPKLRDSSGLRQNNPSF